MIASCALLHAQDVVPDTTRTEEALERIFDTVELEQEDMPDLETLQWRQDNPFDLNRVTFEQLLAIPGVSPFQASAILQRRSLLGKYSSVAQLEFIDEVGKNGLLMIQQYVTVSNLPPPEVRLRARLGRDVQVRQGFRDGSFTGSILKPFSRMSARTSALHMGVLAEKDPGERFGDGFLSGYVMIEKTDVLPELLLGDYVVAAGQGLVLWRRSSFGKSLGVPGNVRRSGQGVHPFRSSDEFHFLRGAAATMRFDLSPGKVVTSLFASSRRLDGTLKNDDSVSTLYDAGLFRTETEKRKLGVVRENLWGGRAVWISRSLWTLGGTWSMATFDKSVRLAGTSYTRSVSVLGVDGTWEWRHLSLFGEIASIPSQGSASIIGSVVHLSKQTDIALSFRNYTPLFANPHAHGFGEGDETRNERGWYIGSRLAPTEWLRLHGYVDYFLEPAASQDLPRHGHEIALQSEWILSRSVEIECRVTNKRKEINGKLPDLLSRESAVRDSREQRRIRITGRTTSGRYLRLKTRIEATDVQYPRSGKVERGVLVFQDIWLAVHPRLTAEVRVALFDTDSYDARIYMYENDLRGVFSNPALFGRGRRWYLLLRYAVDQLFQFALKYAEYYKEDVTELGSGAAEVAGSFDNHISLQMDVRF